MKNNPKGAFLLIFTQLWESFSFFGMRTLLVLFMIQKLGFPDTDSIGIYALYATLVNLGGLLGGYCGDQIFGLRRAVFLGGLFIASGHICLSIERDESLFYMGLSCIIVGSSLFSPNLKALFGRLFEKEDPRRESNFILYYTGINAGGFSAAILCGYVAQTYGWHAGFGLAAIGMFTGLAFLFKSRRIIAHLGNTPYQATGLLQFAVGIVSIALVAVVMALLQYQQAVSILLPALGICLAARVLYQLKSNPAFNQVLTLCSFIFCYLAFFIVEDLMSTVLILFCENNVDRMVGGFEVPSTALVAINPLTIIFLGGVFAFFAKKNKKVLTIRSMLKMNSLAFLLLGAAFCVLFLGSFAINAAGLTPLPYVIASFALIAIAELFIAPSLFAYCSQSMPYALSGLAMGMITFGRSYASLFSGMLGKAITQSTLVAEPSFFGTTALGCLAIGVLLVALVQKQRKVEPLAIKDLGHWGHRRP